MRTIRQLKASRRNFMIMYFTGMLGVIKGFKSQVEAYNRIWNILYNMEYEIQNLLEHLRTQKNEDYKQFKSS